MQTDMEIYMDRWIKRMIDRYQINIDGKKSREISKNYLNASREGSQTDRRTKKQIDGQLYT